MLLAQLLYLRCRGVRSRPRTALLVKLCAKSHLVNSLMVMPQLNRPGFDGDSVSTERWADVSTEEVFTGVAGASGPARF